MPLFQSTGDFLIIQLLNVMITDLAVTGWMSFIWMIILFGALTTSDVVAPATDATPQVTLVPRAVGLSMLKTVENARLVRAFVPATDSAGIAMTS